MRYDNETPGGAQPMAAFKCNEAANDQLIRLFVLGRGRLRVEELNYVHESTHACSLRVTVFKDVKLSFFKIQI